MQNFILIFQRDVNDTLLAEQEAHATHSTQIAAVLVEVVAQVGSGTAAFDAVRVLALDEGVKVSHEEEALHVWILAVLDGRANGADVIADVEGAGRVDAGAHYGTRNVI